MLWTKAVVFWQRRMLRYIKHANVTRWRFCSNNEWVMGHVSSTMHLSLVVNLNGYVPM